jgi:hypothetical protein
MNIIDKKLSMHSQYGIIGKERVDYAIKVNFLPFKLTAIILTNLLLNYVNM